MSAHTDAHPSGGDLIHDARATVRPRGLGRSYANSIFQQAWWLDAVAPGRWGEATVERGGETVARLPYAVHGRGRFRVLSQPPLTATLGPWTARVDGSKEATVIGSDLELMATLEERLPPAAAFRQDFAPSVMNALPFLWAGYSAEVRYTYRLEDLSSEDRLWAGLGGNIRREIRKARERVVVRDDLDLDRFLPLWAKTFERQGRRSPEAGTLARIEEACAGRDARTMLFACDDADRVHAVAYIVWDRHAAYYLLGGGDPDLRTSGASSLLMWEAVNRARLRTEVFDFEGSMLKPVERFFRAFGGRQTPYLHVSRAGRLARSALELRAAIRRRSDRSR